MTGADPVTPWSPLPKPTGAARGRQRARDWIAHSAQACHALVIGLPGGQQWALRRMERSLLADDPRLDSLYAIFSRDTRHAAMPLTEKRPGRRSTSRR